MSHKEKYHTMHFSLINVFRNLQNLNSGTYKIEILFQFTVRSVTVSLYSLFYQLTQNGNKVIIKIKKTTYCQRALGNFCETSGSQKFTCAQHSPQNGNQARACMQEYTQECRHKQGLPHSSCWHQTEYLKMLLAVRSSSVFLLLLTQLAPDLISDSALVPDPACS